MHLHSGTAARKNAIASAEKLSRCASGAGFTNLLCKKHSSSTRLQVRASCRQASHSYFFIFSQMALAQRPASRPRTTFSIGSQTLPKSTPSGKKSLKASHGRGGASALKPARGGASALKPARANFHAKPQVDRGTLCLILNSAITFFMAARTNWAEKFLGQSYAAWVRSAAVSIALYKSRLPGSFHTACKGLAEISILRDFLQKWKVECRADGLVTMRFAIFPFHLSKRLRLPRQGDARSYEIPHLSRKIISANRKIWCSKMQPFSRNQRPDLLTALMSMSLVLRLPRKMHLCRSSSNVPRLPSVLKLRQYPHHLLLSFDKVHNPLRLPPETTSECLYIILYYTAILYCIILYYIILYYILLYYIILYCYIILLYYTILYCIKLYYIILHIIYKIISYNIYYTLYLYYYTHIYIYYCLFTHVFSCIDLQVPNSPLWAPQLSAPWRDILCP